VRLYLNSSDSLTNKKYYLLRAAEKLGINVVASTPQTLPENVDYSLNIEPYERFIPGNKWTGIWEIDLLLDRQDMNEINWQLADTVFIAVNTIPDRLKKFKSKTRLLFQACDPDLYKTKVIPEYDVVFSGSMHSPVYSERERIYNIVKEFCNYKGFDNTGLFDYINILKLAKVQFIRSMKTPIGDGELAQRFFECLAIGPVLTNYVDDLKHTGLIEDTDYMAYRNDKDMLEKLSYLVKHPEFASKMAQNGALKARMYHTYTNRLISILNTINYG